MDIGRFTKNHVLTSPQFFCENTLYANRCGITVTFGGFNSSRRHYFQSEPAFSV
jgi:hypothetical protein